MAVVMMSCRRLFVRILLAVPCAAQYRQPDGKLAAAAQALAVGQDRTAM
jgi:hypothetical protein